jgi:PQQ-dependent dehydrogenase (methanol/ethanol family)
VRGIRICQSNGMRGLWLIAAAALTACGSSNESDTVSRASTTPGASPTHAAVNAARLGALENEPGQWLTTGGNYEEQRFSALDRINPQTAGGLGLAWYADLQTNLTQESTPLVIDGVAYVTEAWSKVTALDAATGALLWRYDPEVPGERASMGCCSVPNRGVAAWNGKIYVGAFDGRLIALDAASGRVVWSVVTVDQSKPYSITGAPRVVKGLVIIGNGGAELGVRGYVTAYDAETGEKAWRFYTVPGDPDAGPDGEASDEALAQIAADTWSGEFWRMGGGGTVWDAIVYDPVSDLLYLGVGNGSPWNASLRSPGGGDNLFLSSIVAVRPETGEYVWHFQQTPAESWDYTATMPIMVADLAIDGERRRVVMQAPKNGFFYVLDARTGQFISARNFVPQNWALRLDPVTGRPDVSPDARYDVTDRPTIVTPGPGGGHSWHPWAYSPKTGLVYLSARHTSGSFAASPSAEIGIYRLGVDWLRAGYLYDEPGNEHFARPAETASELIAWDPIAQRAMWKTQTRPDGGAGVLATAGDLVFAGSPSSKEFVAYRADDGSRVWAFPIQTGAVAAPVSYAIDGEQYVLVVAGSPSEGGYYAPNYSRVLAFSLGGAAQLPPVKPFAPPVLSPPPLTASAEDVARGGELYGLNCAICHGDRAVARGGGRGTLFPDLRYSPALASREAFGAVVLDGLRESNGMRSFSVVLNGEGAEAIRGYLVAAAKDAVTPGDSSIAEP